MVATVSPRERSPVQQSRWRLFALALGAIAVVVLPHFLGDSYVLQLVNFGLIGLIVVVGLNYITGYCGQINFAQAAFYGIGAYTTAVLMLKGLSFWLAMPLAAMATGLCSVVLGVPTLRLRAFYLAMATIGFSEIVQLVLIHWEPVTGGTSGLRGIPGVSLFGFALQGQLQHYYFLLAWAAFGLWLAVRVRSTQLGRSMLALRDTEIAAEVAGVNTTRIKSIALALSAIYAGIAGALYVTYIGYVSPDGFSTGQSIQYYTMLIIGGTGSAVGAVVGTITLTALPELLRFLREWYLVLYGLGVIAIIAVLPGGLVGLPRRLRRRSAPTTAPAHVSTATVEASPAASASSASAAEATRTGEMILSIKGVTQRFGGLIALDDVNIDVREGTVHAVIGPNGAGKTCFLNVLTGAYIPQAGSVKLLDRELLGLRPFQITHLGLSRNFQNIRIYPSLSVLENVMVGQACRSSINTLQSFLGTPASRREERAIKLAAREALVFVGLSEHADRPAESLAYAQRRLLEIARAIATQPRVLLLDEPAAGMNVQESTELMALIRAIRARGTTIVLVEHNMRLVMGVSDRISVLDFGKKLAEGSKDEIRQNPAVIEAYLGQTVTKDSRA
ncbi:MAG: branched-chain amino acid ABC transporter ATP-binding protein/permease [Betaproteobacteria bacterium]